MALDPISLGIAAVSTGLGIFQGSAQNAAAAQQHRDQAAFQAANAKFAKWQASFNKKAADAQGQFNYYQQVVDYNQNLAYTNSLRNFELVKAIDQAEVVSKTRAAAGANYMQQSSAIGEMLSESEMQDAVSLQQYQWRAMQARSSVQAMDREGRSVDRLINSYAQSLGDYETIMEINKGLRRRQYTRQQQAALSDYLSKWESQDFYKENKYMDPVPPYPPLPTIMMPPPPSMSGAPPSGAAAALNIGSAVLGGVNTYFSAASAIKQLKAGS